MEHPLPIGTRVSYADISPRINGVVVANDNTDPVFIAAVEKDNQHHPNLEGTAPTDFDYCITVDDEGDNWVPVQGGGIKDPISRAEHLENIR